ncbi:MAG TPA: DUF4339 domain-containing protein [Pirellulales bacterium]|nr:DUF4339 domain-containing protein [Pirellulales bacterium]
MSGNWYCLAFGIELGPMARDDLAQLASSGQLSPDSQVREGAAGAWVAARTVAGLFPAGGEAIAESRWYYEFMGEVLGPMKFEDLRLLAEQGNLRPENRVREGDRGVWKPASAVPELFKSERPAGEADTDFELSAPHWVSRPASAPVDRSTSSKPPSAPPADVPPAVESDDTDFDLGPPQKAE